MAPNFSTYPFERLRKLSRREAALESTLARWIAARSTGDRLVRLVAGRSARAEAGPSRSAVRVELVAPSRVFDPFAARCEVRVPGGGALEVRGSSMGVRAIAQHVLGGPAELQAARPLGVVERSIFSLVVATALEDLGVAGEVWPILDDTLVDDHGGRAAAVAVAKPADDATRIGHAAGAERSKQRLHVHRAVHRGHAQHDHDAGDDQPRIAIVELAVALGDISLAVQLHAPPELLSRVPPAMPLPAWFDTARLDVPIVVGRCALERAALDRLAVRAVITLERAAGNAELALLGGAVGLAAPQRAVEAKVATGYVARDMSLPDQAHIELTVALGTTQLSLREISELAIGQIIQLGRPLAGPFELRAAGRVVGRGELVDVDGELAVRIVSLGD